MKSAYYSPLLVHLVVLLVASEHSSTDSLHQFLVDCLLQNKLARQLKVDPIQPSG